MLGLGLAVSEARWGEDKEEGVGVTGAGEEVDAEEEEAVPPPPPPMKSFIMSARPGFLCGCSPAPPPAPFFAVPLPLDDALLLLGFPFVKLDDDEGVEELELRLEEAGRVPKDLTPSAGFLKAGALAGEEEMGAEASSMEPKVTDGDDPRGIVRVSQSQKKKKEKKSRDKGWD